MKNHNCNFTLASKDNYDDYYKIRSEKTNLYWTGYNECPDYDKFFIWYKDRILDKEKDLYLIYNDNVCIGSLNIDYYDKTALIGYSVKENLEGQGFATYIVNNAVNIIKEKESYVYIRAWINAGNIGSIKVIEKNGFSKTPIFENRKRFGELEKYLQFELKITN